MASGRKNGTHSTRRSTGQGGHGRDKNGRKAIRPTPLGQLQTVGMGSPGSLPTAGMSRGSQGEHEGVSPPTSVHRCGLPHGHSGCVTRERRRSTRPGRLYKRYITWWHQSARRRCSCQVPGTAESRTKPKGLEAQPSGRRCQSKAGRWPPQPCLYMLLPPQRTQRETCLAPRSSSHAGQQGGAAAPLHPGPRQPLSSCPSPRGAARGPRAGEARGPAAPSSLSLHHNVCGEPALQRLRDWLGQPSLCLVICRSSKKQNKPKGKEERRKKN